MKLNMIYWAPRVLAIFFLLFLFAFSFDVFDPNLSIQQMLGGFIMHNIPVIILGALLWLSWRNELVGVITFSMAAVLYIIMLVITASMDRFEWYMISWSVIIAGPAILTAYLWFLSWKSNKIKSEKKKKRKYSS